MSRLRFTKVAQPSTPSANKAEVYVDTADRRLKMIDDLGTVSVLTPDGTNLLNYLDNPGMDVNQRVTTALTTLAAANGGAPSATARVATIDRWPMITQTVASPQFQWVDTIAAPETGITARYYARYKQITGAGKQMVTQTLIGSDTSRLRGKTVRIQFKLRLSVGSNKTLKIGLIQNNSAATVDTLAATFVSAWGANSTDPTLGTNLAYIVPNSTGLDNTAVLTNGLSCAVTSSWQRFSGTFLVPTTCVNLTVAVWSDSQMAINDDNLITEAGLYLGSEIMDFAPIPQELDVRACQRYFAKSFPAATVPAQNAGTTGCCVGVVAKAGAVALASKMFIRFPVTMYKTPATPVLYSPSSAAAQPWRIDGAAPAVQSAAAISQTGDQGFVVTATGDAAGVVGDMVGVHYSADAEI